MATRVNCFLLDLIVLKGGDHIINADMQTFLLPDVLEDLRSPANLRYQARWLLAQN